MNFLSPSPLICGAREIWGSTIEKKMYDNSQDVAIDSNGIQKTNRSSNTSQSLIINSALTIYKWIFFSFIKCHKKFFFLLLIHFRIILTLASSGAAKIRSNSGCSRCDRQRDIGQEDSARDLSLWGGKNLLVKKFEIQLSQEILFDRFIKNQIW